MKRLTSEEVKVDESVDRYLGPLADLEGMKPKLLDLILNGPVLNGVSKDVLRQIIRQLYSALAAYEGTGLTPERCAEFARADAEGRYIVMRDAEQEGVARLRELAEADRDGRLVVLPCKVGERWTDEDGRAVRITAVIVSIEPFGTNINIYFDYEDATPDDAGSDCMANWDYFSRHYTCIEAERATEGAT